MTSSKKSVEKLKEKEKLKEILPFIICLNKTSSIKNWCISESSRLIADIIDICDKKNLG